LQVLGGERHGGTGEGDQVLRHRIDLLVAFPDRTILADVDVLA
jgi:hypothetical protein